QPGARPRTGHPTVERTSRGTDTTRPARPASPRHAAHRPETHSPPISHDTETRPSPIESDPLPGTLKVASPSAQDVLPPLLGAICPDRATQHRTRRQNDRSQRLEILRSASSSSARPGPSERDWLAGSQLTADGTGRAAGAG